MLWLLFCYTVIAFVVTGVIRNILECIYFWNKIRQLDEQETKCSKKKLNE